MVLTLEIHVWEVGSRLPIHGLLGSIPLIAFDHLSHLLSPVIFLLYLPNSNPFIANPYSFYTCLHHILPLPLTVWVSGCECRASRLTCHALKWISCGIFLLRSVFGKKKRQVKHGRCPDQASVNPNRLRGKEPMIGKEVSLKHLRI